MPDADCGGAGCALMPVHGRCEGWALEWVRITGGIERLTTRVEGCINGRRDRVLLFRYAAYLNRIREAESKSRPDQNGKQPTKAL